MMLTRIFLCLLVIPLLVVTSSSPVNLAKERATEASSFSGNSYSADRAVDGKTSTLFRSNEAPDDWWRVDLDDVLIVRRIVVHTGAVDRFTNVSILSTTMNNPTDVPHPESSDWIVRKSGVTRSGGDKTLILDFARDESIEARHIALYSAAGGIALNELEVYDSVNIAEGRPTFRKAQYNQYFGSEKAVDVNPGSSYKSLDETNQWWRVELDDTVYVRILAIRNEDSERFKDVSILPSTHSTITEDPTPTSSEWTLVMSGISRESDTSSTELTYNFDINNELQTRHIALYSSNSIGLSITEVQIYKYDLVLAWQKKSVSLTARNSSCVTLTWTEPGQDFGEVSNYRYKCTSHDDWTITENTELQTQICGYSPYTDVQCELEAWSSYHYSSITTSVAQTLCTAPSKPTAVKLTDETPLRMMTDGKFQLLYFIQWAAPESSNCESITGYDVRYPTTESTPTQISSTSISILTDDNVEITFSVRAKNNDDIYSDYETLVFTSDKLGPVWSGTPQLLIHPSSSECVSLSWTLPDFPNGNIQKYEIQCTGHTEWTEVESSKLDTLVCGYSPNTEVECTVRAWNEQTSSDVFTSDKVNTYCSSSTSPKNIQFTNKDVKTESGRRRREYLITWQTPTTINCDSITEYEIRFPTSSSDIITMISRSITVYTEGDVEVTFWVRAVNNAGNISKPEIKTITTATFKPQIAPEDFQLEVVNSSCIKLSWQPPEYPNGPITQYEYNCTGHSVWVIVEKTTLGSVECGYLANQLVECEIFARNSKGKSDSARKDTRIVCAAPEFSHDLSPHILEVTSNNSDGLAEINLTLLASSVIRINCDSLTSLEYKLSDQDNYTNAGEVIHGLQPYTNYTLHVRAANNEQFTQNLTWKLLTKQLAPSDSPTIITDFEASCVNLTISPPEHPNGLLTHYLYACDELNIGIDENLTRVDNISVSLEEKETKLSLCNLTSATKVICTVRGVNSAGESPVAVVDGYTKLKLKKKNHTLIEVTSSSLEEILPITIATPLFERGNVSKYQIVLQEQSKQNRKKRDFSLESDRCNSTQLFNYSVSQEKGLTCYIAAEIFVESDGETTFNIGDGKTYGGYENVALVPEADYFLVVVAVVTVENSNQSFVQFFPHTSLTAPVKVSPTVRSTVPPAPPKCGTGCVVGIVMSLIVCLAVGAAVAGFVIFRRRQAKGSNEGASPALSLVSVSEVSTALEGPSTSSQQPAPPSPENEAIPVSQLAQYITEKLMNDILEQYKILEKLEKPVMRAASLPENRGKCKYIGLYPEDKTRVVLERNGGEGSDFINASHIKGYTEQDLFIAAQGPQERTVDDFWLMIWQQKAKGIVMVTNIIEGGKVKCVQYWPDKVGESSMFGDIKVTFITHEVVADYTIRTISAEMNGQNIKLKQFHFESWPDQRVPEVMSPLLCFVKKVRSETGRAAGPLVVHCSAGVGRTGTFIALNILAKEAKDKNEVNPFECVKEMRKRRPCMVQKQEQYQFVYEALEEFLVTDDYVCEPALLTSKIQTHLEETTDMATYANTMGNSIDLISQEFERLEVKKGHTAMSFSVAMSEENKDKNRDPNVLASDKSCMWADGGYINAVSINDYQKKGHIIVTQLPLPNTVKDFWAMVIDNGVKLIVQLLNQDGCFYPANNSHTMKCGEFLVTRMSSEVGDGVTSIKISIENKGAVYNADIILVTDWPENEEFPKTTSMLAYLGELEKYQRQHGDQRICLVDLNGSNRCGLFVSAYNAVEKLKTEQEVDLYNTVLMLRHIRPEFVSDLRSYVYLYQLLQQYIDTFSEYGNFQ